MNVFKNGKLVYVIINGIKYLISNGIPTTPPENIPVSTVTISNKISQLTQNVTHQLNVNVLPYNATDKTLTYTSSNISIATVSNTGLITAKSVGSCTVTVKSINNITDTMTLTVQSATIPVTSVSLNKTTSTLIEGNSETLTVTVLPTDATNSSVTWSTSDSTIATVTSGVVLAKKAGSVIITATANDGSGKKSTCNYTINSATIPVTDITVSPTSGTLYPNQTTKITANVIPSNATNKNVTWTSLDTNIATVDSNGNVTAVAIGSTTIRCTTADGGFIANYSLNVIEQIVVPPLEDVVYDNPTYGDKVLTLDGRILTVARLFDTDSQYYNSAQACDEVTYNSSEGRYYLTNRIGVTKTGSINFTSTAEKSYITLTDESGNNILHKVQWSTGNTPASYGVNIEDSRVIPVGRDAGAIGAGCIGILAYNQTNNFYIKNTNLLDPTIVSGILSNKTIRYILVTEEVNIPLAKEGEAINVASVKMNKAIVGLNKNNTKQLSYALEPSTASNKNVTWTSSDTKIATVDNKGIVKAISEGQAKIIVTTQDGNLTSSTNVIVSVPYAEEHLFNGAYVQMYYYEPKIDLGTDLIIPFYISDDEQTEFYTDDYSKRFTLVVTIDDIERRFAGLQAGDQEVNLGKLTEGEHSIVFQGIDESTGARGMAIYKEVWVVNPATYPITEAQTYTMKPSDLTTFAINNQNNDDLTICEATRDGLNNLWNWCVDNGYRKIKMLPGTYRVECSDRSKANVLSIPSKFTVDGVSVDLVKFKRKPNLEVTDLGKTTFLMEDCEDSHLINCWIDDDAQDRIDAGVDSYTLINKNGENFNTFYYRGGRYCSYENCKITNAVGHSTLNSGGNLGGNVGGNAIGFAAPKYVFDESKPSIIDSTNNVVEKCFILNGNKVFSDKYVTSPMLDIKTWACKTQYIIFGNNAGYSWFRGISQYVYYHFYNEDGEFVVTISTMQLRPVMIPIGCRFVRASILSYEDNTGGGTFFFKEQGTHMSLSNNYFENCRTTAYAPTCSRGLLMENNTYINCGRLITPSNVDFEDGWQQSIDVFYRNNSSTPHANASADVITVCGVNHVYENNNERIYSKHYMAGCVYRNNNSGKYLKIGLSYDQYSRYNRVYNNENANLAVSQWIGEFTQTEIDIKEKHAYTGVQGGTLTAFPGGYKSYTTEPDYPNNKTRNATVKGGGGDSWFVKCNIYPQPYLNGNLFFDECNFYNFDDVNTAIRFSFNATNVVRKFTNCYFKSPSTLDSHNSFNSGTFEGCTFEKATTIKPNNANAKGDLVFNNCTFKELATINITNTGCYIVFNNCTFEKGKSFSGSGQANSEFNNCIG